MPINLFLDSRSQRMTNYSVAAPPPVPHQTRSLHLFIFSFERIAVQLKVKSFNNSVFSFSIYDDFYRESAWTTLARPRPAPCLEPPRPSRPTSSSWPTRPSPSYPQKSGSCSIVPAVGSGSWQNSQFTQDTDLQIYLMVFFDFEQVECMFCRKFCSVPCKFSPVLFFVSFNSFLIWLIFQEIAASETYSSFFKCYHVL